jgi:hypothetical protein
MERGLTGRDLVTGPVPATGATVGGVGAGAGLPARGLTAANARPSQCEHGSP